MSLGEIQNESGSGSLTRYVFSSLSPGVVTQEQVNAQVEGAGITASWKLYSVTNPSGTQISNQILQLNVTGPLLNISLNGAAGTGAITTGAFLTAGIANSMTTQRFLGVGGYVGLEDTGVLDTSGNALDAPSTSPTNWWLLRYNKAASRAEQSLSTDGGGNRIWSALGGGSGVTSLDGLVGALTIGSSTGFIGVTASGTTIDINIGQSVATTATVNFDKVIASGTPGVASIVATNGYMQSGDGFNSLSTSATAVNIPNGTIYGKILTSGSVILMVGSGSAPSGPLSGQSSFYADAAGQPLWWDHTSSAWIPFSVSTGSGVLSITGTANEIIASAPTGNVTLSTPQPIGTSSSVNFGNVTTSGAFNSTATGGSTAIQVNGGTFSVLGNGSVFGQAASFNGISSSTTITAASTIQSTTTGASVAFQAGGGALTIAGNGNIQGQGATFNSVNSTGLANFASYDVNGNVFSDSSRNIFVNSISNTGAGVLINSIGQFVGAGVNVGVNGVACGGLTVSGTLFCDSSRNVSCASIFIAGQFRPSALSGTTFTTAPTYNKWFEVYNSSGTFLGITPIF